MAHSIKLLARNYNGELTFCTCCKTYHLHFNNLFFEFTRNELTDFKQMVYFSEDLAREAEITTRMMKRTIPIETGKSNMILIFNAKEIEALRGLVFFEEKKSIKDIDPIDIDFDFSLN